MTFPQVSKRCLVVLLALFFPLLMVQGFIAVGSQTSVVFFTAYPLVLLVVTLAYPSVVRAPVRVTSLLILCVGIAAFQLWLPTSSSPDATADFYTTTHYDLSSLMHIMIAYFDLTTFKIVSSRQSFPFIQKLFLGNSTAFGPDVIAFFNVLFWVLATFSWVNAVQRKQEHPIYQDKRFLNTLFVLFLVSPTIVYWSANFEKDILVTALSVLSATAWFRNKYCFALLWLIPAVLLRPYSVAVVGAFCLFLRPDGRRLRWFALWSAVAVALLGIATLQSSISPVGNIPVAGVYFFLSPNPVDPSNWMFYKNTGTWVLSPIIFTVEGLVFGVFLMVGLFSLKNRRWRCVFSSLGIPILIIAAALIVVGTFHQSALGLQSHFWAFGDNFLRKKVNAFPLVLTWSAICITLLQSGFPTRSRLLDAGISR